MVMAWCETIRAGRAFSEADAPRFRRAFQVLANTMTSWPAPVHFLNVLPAPEHIAYQRIAHDESSAKDRAESKRIIDEIAAHLKTIKRDPLEDA